MLGNDAKPHSMDSTTIKWIGLRENFTGKPHILWENRFPASGVQIFPTIANPFNHSLDWFKGTFTGKPHDLHGKNHGFL